MAQAVEQPYFVPDSVKADVLFQNMRSGNHPLAVALDEYGGMTGIVTINDLVEQLVGDLGEEDCDQNAPAMIEKLEGETWRIRGDAWRMWPRPWAFPSPARASTPSTVWCSAP